ncbi:MAG: hypothetical protein DRH44_03600 [Candidatus Coatesbacteria bacterium]|nr:MAG: hypothetical protein DRH44_03600 [Candidatus Coatesbacteria bacterium]
MAVPAIERKGRKIKIKEVKMKKLMVSLLVPVMSFALILGGDPELVDDAYVSSCAPNSNTGGRASLQVQIDENCQRRVLIRFCDLPDYFDDYDVVSAILVLYASCTHGGTGYILAVANDWDEYDVCWANQPSVYYSLVIQVEFYETEWSGDWAYFNILEIAEKWFSGEFLYYGLLLRPAGWEDKILWIAHSTDSEPEYKRPYLELELDPPLSVRSSSLGMLKALYK